MAASPDFLMTVDSGRSSGSSLVLVKIASSLGMGAERSPCLKPSRSHWLKWKYYARPESPLERSVGPLERARLYQLLEGAELVRGTRLGLQSPAPGP
jgi:hypothetical protein